MEKGLGGVIKRASSHPRSLPQKEKGGGEDQDNWKKIARRMAKRTDCEEVTHSNRCEKKTVNSPEGSVEIGESR